MLLISVQTVCACVSCRNSDCGADLSGPRSVCQTGSGGGSSRRRSNGHRGPQLHHQGLGSSHRFCVTLKSRSEQRVNSMFQQQQCQQSNSPIVPSQICKHQTNLQKKLQKTLHCKCHHHICKTYIVKPI